MCPSLKDIKKTILGEGETAVLHELLLYSLGDSVKTTFILFSSVS
jgi:hypothetical protein